MGGGHGGATGCGGPQGPAALAWRVGAGPVAALGLTSALPSNLRRLSRGGNPSLAQPVIRNRQRHPGEQGEPHQQEGVTPGAWSSHQSPCPSRATPLPGPVSWAWAASCVGWWPGGRWRRWCRGGEGTGDTGPRADGARPATPSGTWSWLGPRPRGPACLCRGPRSLVGALGSRGSGRLSFLTGAQSCLFGVLLAKKKK